MLIVRDQSRRAVENTSIADFKEKWATYLEIAVRVEEQVGWFEVSMEDVGGVEGFQCA